MKNPSLSLLAQVAVAIIAVFTLLFTLNQLDNEKKEVQRLYKENQELQNELNLSNEEKLALQQDTAQLRSHADKSFGAMSIFLKRLIAQGDGEWVAKKLGVKAPTPLIRNSWREMEQAQDL